MDIPGDIELLDCENLVILEIPSFLNVKGFIMVVFGAQSVAVFHLNPNSANMPEGYTLLGTQPLITQETLPESKVTIARLITSSHVPISENTA